MVERPYSSVQLIQIFFDTATFDEIEQDKKVKTDAQLSLIGSTMGLLTDFSILSGVEILCLTHQEFKALLSFKGNHQQQGRGCI